MKSSLGDTVSVRKCVRTRQRGAEKYLLLLLALPEKDFYGRAFTASLTNQLDYF